MKRLIIILLSLSFLLSLNSCYYQRKKLEWLAGTWRFDNEPTKYEIWGQRGFMHFFGRVVIRQPDQEPEITERMVIEQKLDELYYTAAPRGQNNGVPIEFKMVNDDLYDLHFSNPDHDYPTDIRYTRKDEDHMLIIISGKVNGVEQSTTFYMTRFHGVK